MFKEIWDACCQGVAAGEATDSHTSRDAIADLLKRRMAFLATTLSQVKEMGEELNEPFEREEDKLLAELAHVQRIQREIFDRWRTAEDLEELAAETTALSASAFDALAQKLGPPTEWLRQGSARG
jgi:hypothetical protein